MYSLRTLARKGIDIFRQDSLSWGLSLHSAWTLAAVPVLIILGMVAAIRLPAVFVWITNEDALMEWLQFLLVFASSLVFAAIGLRFLQGRQRGIGSLCLLVALGTFFVAGEEIAWGQRVFGWSTPEALEAANVQQETTLHNISSAHPIFVYAVMLAGLYGVLAPVLKAALWKKRQPTALSFLLVPPLCLVPAFFMPFGYRLSRLVFGVDALFPHLIFYITKFSEVTELCLYFGLLAFAWLNLRRLRP